MSEQTEQYYDLCEALRKSEERAEIAEKKSLAGQENVKYWATQFNELRSQFDEMQKRAEAAEAQASRVQELEQQNESLELLVERIYEDADEFIDFLQGMGGRNHFHMANDLEDWTRDVEKLMNWGGSDGEDEDE